MGSLVLLDLLGGVALLLWGLHMVLTGVLRAFGPDLRRLLGKALRNRFTAFGAAGEVSQMDNIVDRLNEAIKLYITKLTRGSLDEREGRRAMAIVSFTINLEHIGDIIDKNLSELAAKKIKRRYQFSAEGAAELAAFHKRVCESLQVAFGIFMTGDVEGARRLLREKVALRKAELEAADRHFERLREGRPESLETTSLHLDILSDLKRIHSHICSVAYPVLEAAGELPALESASSDATADAFTYQPKLP